MVITYEKRIRNLTIMITNLEGVSTTTNPPLHPPVKAACMFPKAKPSRFRSGLTQSAIATNLKTKLSETTPYAVRDLYITMFLHTKQLCTISFTHSGLHIYSTNTRPRGIWIPVLSAGS